MRPGAPAPPPARPNGADFVRSLAAAGYTKLSVRDIARLAMAGVNADYIREMAKYRDKK